MGSVKQFWIIERQNKTTAIAHWEPLKGLILTDDPRTPDEIEASALGKGHEVNYCSIAHGVGRKTIDAICKKLGYGWDATHRITIRQDNTERIKGMFQSAAKKGN